MSVECSLERGGQQAVQPGVKYRENNTLTDTEMELGVLIGYMSAYEVQ